MEDNTLVKSGRNIDEISLRELIMKVREWLRYLQSKWQIILISGVLGAILGFSYAYLKKPIYKAELSFALEDEKTSGGLGGALGLASQFGIDLGGGGGGAFSGDNLLQLMKSRSMIEKTLLTPVTVKGKIQTLAQLYINFNNFRDNWTNKKDLQNIQFLPGAIRSKFSIQQDSLLGEFHKQLTKSNLTVDKIDKKLSIIYVDVKSKNELFSKYFVEALVNNISMFYIDAKTKKSAQNVNILQHQTDSVRRELNEAITGVASSIDRVPNVNAQRQVLRTPSQRRQVDVQANTAMLTELVKNLQIAKINLRKETPLIQIIDTPILPLEIERVSKIKSVFFVAVLFVVVTIIYLSFTKFMTSILEN